MSPGNGQVSSSQDKTAERRIAAAVGRADRRLAANARTCRIECVAYVHIYALTGMVTLSVRAGRSTEITDASVILCLG